MTDERPLPIVVLDTNVLIAAAYAPHSASRRIVEACLEGRLRPVISTAVRREYEFIVSRAAGQRKYRDTLLRWLEQCRVVEPSETPRVVPDDPDDDKLLALALAADADAIVTNDRHLLALDPYQGIRILTPSAFAEQYLE